LILACAQYNFCCPQLADEGFPPSPRLARTQIETQGGQGICTYKNIVGLVSDITRRLRGCGSQFHGIGNECLKRSGCS